MTINEAEKILATASSPYLMRDLKKFIKRQKRKEGVYGKTKKRNRPKAI